MKNNISIVGSKCTGCGLCEYKCPNSAIKLKESKEKFHFIYPTIDSKKCIDCGLCLKTCHSYKQNHLKRKAPEVYSFTNNDKDSLLNSTSGGAFYKIAKNIINKGGVVYGAAFDDNLKVKHIRAENIKELELIQGSKYIQSDIGINIFKQLVKDVSNKRKVLYSGTPCQIASISFLFNCKIPSNLYLVDIVCHGVPNQWSFDECIKAEEIVKKIKILNFKFRAKNISSLNNYAFSYIFEKKNKKYYLYSSRYNNLFYRYFHTNAIYRESCYSCQYNLNHRYSDITLGDFWNINKVDPSYNSALNVSMVFSNSDKGDELITILKIDKEFDFNDVYKLNESYFTHSSYKMDYSFYKNLENNKYATNFYKINKTKVRIQNIKTHSKNAVKRFLNLFIKKKYVIEKVYKPQIINRKK